MKNKLERYLQNKQNNYIIEEGKFIYNKLKGNWNKIFKNNNPIFLEFPIPEFALAISNALLGREADSTPKLKIKFIIIMYINRIILN